MKHVGSHHAGPSIVWLNRTDGTDRKLRSRSVKIILNFGKNKKLVNFMFDLTYAC